MTNQSFERKYAELAKNSEKLDQIEDKILYGVEKLKESSLTPVHPFLLKLLGYIVDYIFLLRRQQKLGK